MTWCTERNCRNKSPAYGAVQPRPLGPGRPCLVSREGLALAGELAAGKSSAEEGESKEREPHCVSVLAR